MLYKIQSMWYNIRRRDFVMGQNTIPLIGTTVYRFEQSINLMVSEKPSDHWLCSYFFYALTDTYRIVSKTGNRHADSSLERAALTVTLVSFFASTNHKNSQKPIEFFKVL